MDYPYKLLESKFLDSLVTDLKDDNIIAVEMIETKIIRMEIFFLITYLIFFVNKIFMI